MQFSSLACLLLTGVLGVVGAFDLTNSKSNLVVYWGQNSRGDTSTKPEDQKPLGWYCDNGASVHAFIIAFIINPTAGPILNFASAGGHCSQENPMICPEIAADIKKCQGQGKKILLSIGGEAGIVQFESQQNATDNAQQMWDMFGPKGSASNGPRPFGDVAVDGFDLDIEDLTPSKFLVDWANKMKELMSDKGFLTAAPQCPSPNDNSLKSLLNSKKLDAVFVQFYNNPQCPTGADGFSTWEASASANDFKFFLGLPADRTANKTAGGYLEVEQMKGYVTDAHKSEHFRGVMLWDASQAWANNNYHLAVGQALNATT